MAVSVGGPRTAAGKARSSQNARRHGLNKSALHDARFAGPVLALVKAIAGEDRNPVHRAIALHIAAAQVDVMRVRRVVWELFSEPSRIRSPAKVPSVAALNRYEQRALSRRNRAIRQLDFARLAAADCATLSVTPSPERAARSHLSTGGTASIHPPLEGEGRETPGACARGRAGWGDKTNPTNAAGTKGCQNKSETSSAAKVTKRTRDPPRVKLTKQTRGVPLIRLAKRTRASSARPSTNCRAGHCRVYGSRGPPRWGSARRNGGETLSRGNTMC
jgi:hypothetical protein